MSEQLRPQESQLSAEHFLQAGSEFLEHFAVEVSPTEQPEQFLEALAQLNPRFQGGRELVRWQLEADQTEWDDATKDVIMRTAESMQMLETETPLAGQFDVVIVLGAARQANLDRARYGAKAIKEGGAQVKQLVIAGSSRPINEVEQKNTANYAAGAKIEFDLCGGAATAVARENPGLILSEMYVGNEHADTSNTVEGVLSTLQTNGSLKDSVRIGAITTQIYRAATALDLARAAKQFGITETFTAGNPSDPSIVAKRTPATYLSEILRTLKAAALAHEPKPMNEVVFEGEGYTIIKDKDDVEHTIADEDLSPQHSEDDRHPGLDKNGRGWGMGGIWYEDWNDPGTYPE
jgi:hypothetical protein